MSFDLYPQETYDRMTSFRPVQVPEPTAFDGFVRGTGMHAMRAFAKAGSAIDLLGSIGPIVKDAFTNGTEAQDRYFREHDEIFGTAVDYWTPKPGEVGIAGEVTGTLLGSLPLLVASPSLLVATTQISTAEELVKKGVDADRAQAVGAVQAAGLGLGIYMPIFGQSLWQRMLLGGAGFNVVQGAAMRGVSGVILKDTPAKDEFHAFDSKSLTLDLLLGLAFGAVSHLSPAQRAQGEEMWARMTEWGKRLKPSDVDALATLRQAQHANVDTLPGKPADAGDNNIHVERLRKATEQVLRNEPVNVTDMPSGKFEADPQRFIDAARRAEQLTTEARKVAKVYGIGESIEPKPISTDQIELPTKTTASEGEFGKADPLSQEARRFVEENPDARISIGRDADGEPVTRTAREYLDDSISMAKRMHKDASLFRIAAACLMGAV